MATRDKVGATDAIPESLLPKRPRLQFGLTAACLVLIFAITYLVYANKAARGASAFVRWYDQIAELTTEEDIYQRHAYPNPPMMAIVLYPLVQLSPFAGAVTWFWLKAGMAVISFYLAFRMVGTADVPVPRGVQFFVLLLAIRPVIGDLTHGNVNLFILFVAMLGLFAFQHGRDAVAGVLLALAAACKVTPLLFLPYFIWKRAWWTVGAFVIGFVVFVLVVPAAFLSWQRNESLLRSWARQMVEPYVTTGEVFYTEHTNQSLPGVVMRLTTHSPSYTRYAGIQRVPVAYNNVLNLTPAQAQWLVRGSLLLYGVLVVAACRTPLAERSGWRLAAEFSVIFLGMLLFSERTWKHHAVPLLLPWTVLLYDLATATGSGRLRSVVVGCVCLAATLLLVTTDGLLPEEWEDIPEVYGAHLVIHLTLLAGVAVILIEAAIWPPPVAPPPPPPEEPPPHAL